MEHIKQPEALSYLSGRLSEDKALEVNEHLADCGPCAEKIRALRILGTQFNEIWDELNPEPTEETYWAQRIADALEHVAATAESSELRERLRGWLGKLHAKAEAVLGVVLDTSKRNADILYKGSENLIRSDSILQFEPVRVRVARREPKETGIISVRAEGPPWVNVSIDPYASKVIIESDMLKAPWPLVLLVPEGEMATAVVGVFRQKDNHLVSEFDNITTGKYKLLLESFS